MSKYLNGVTLEDLRAVFVFCCPHYVAPNKALFNSLAKKIVLKMLVFDKYHFTSTHGCSFCHEYREFYTSVTKSVIANKRSCILLCSATNTSYSISTISSVLKTPLDESNHIWHPPQFFLRCEIKFGIFASSSLMERCKI